MKGEDWPILGYADRFSVSPGGTLNVMVSTDLKEFSAEVVRLGGPQPEPVTVGGTGKFPGHRQPIHPGSYVHVPHTALFDRLQALTLQAWIFPTLPGEGRRQGLVTKYSRQPGRGWRLFIDEIGRLTFMSSSDGHTSQVRSERKLRARNWYFIACTIDWSTGKGRITVQGLRPSPEPETVDEAESSIATGVGPSTDAPLLIGAGGWNPGPRPHADDPYDGKIENPALFSGVLGSNLIDRLRSGEAPGVVKPDAVLASWDFSQGMSSTEASDTSPNRLHGKLVNMPMRATPGHSWEAQEQSFLNAPGQYAAIHFHSDDLSDAGWEQSCQLQLPAELPSGAYSVHLASGDEFDDVPFFVLPKSTARAPILFLVPTFTYLAYGNTHPERGEGPETRPRPSDLFLAKHTEVGRSLYDHHADLSGCCYASRLRPIVTTRPDRLDRPRHLPADLLFLEWLERKGYQYDVITDEELHAAGKEALAGYPVVITGSHPEYYSEVMLDGLVSYVDSGGKLMYLGGNGFYWVTSTPADSPHIMEVRRGYSGTRTWSAEPGELFHSTTGEFGGLWRHRGRSPNQLAGIGFSCQGGPGGSGYSRQTDAFRNEVAFIFKGLAPDEIIGDFGPIAWAAGDEVDRYDVELGSPPNAYLLASALDLDANYKIVIEDLGLTVKNFNATNNPRARGDMVYYERASGGAIFSVGSIYWFRALAVNGDDNNVSRVTENVLRHFLSAGNGGT